MKRLYCYTLLTCAVFASSIYPVTISTIKISNQFPTKINLQLIAGRRALNTELGAKQKRSIKVPGDTLESVTVNNTEIKQLRDTPILVEAFSLTFFPVPPHGSIGWKLEQTGFQALE